MSEPRLGTSSGRGRRWESRGPSSARKQTSRDDLRAKATALEDLLARETFYRELPAIEQHARGIETEYDRRYDEALDARVGAYTKAFDQLVKSPGWNEVDEEQRRKIAAPLERGRAKDCDRLPIPQLRSERESSAERISCLRRGAATRSLQNPTNVSRFQAATTSGSFFVGTTMANLRGLNPYFGTRTLTLVDSMRHVPTNQGGSVDLNFIHR